MQINSSIPNLIGGVSQQPELLRLPSHVKGQLNATSTPARGLSKRPPTVHSGTLPQYPVGTFGNVSIQDFGVRGLFVFNIRPSTGVIEAWRTDGSPVPIYNFSGNPVGPVPYLHALNPHLDVRLIKEADTLFLVNTTKVTAAIDLPPPMTSWPALLWVKAGNYGRTYKVTVPGYGEYSYKTPNGTSQDHVTNTSADVIAQRLLHVLTGGADGSETDGSSWSGPGTALPGVSRMGPVIHFPTSYGNVVVEDGTGGTAMAYIHRSVRSVADLPSRSVPDGFSIKVEGGDTTAAGDHYLSYNAGGVVWEETAQPDAATKKLDPDTMPLRLVPYLSGFKFEAIDWPAQSSGDSHTNPGPQFVGKTINDLFFFQDRLGLISGEGFDLSETSEYFNFYRTTVMDLVDSDPISGVVNHPKVSTLRNAVLYNKRLIFFSNDAQFELTYGDYLSPTNAGTRLITEFAASKRVRPVGIGEGLYFPVDRGGYSAFFNYFVSGSEAQDTAAEITAHVDRYVPREVRHLTASAVTRMLFSVSMLNEGYVYVYQFYQDGGQRVQSAWHRWRLGEDVLAIRAIDDTLWLVTSRGSHYCVEQMSLSDSMGNVTRLDRLLYYSPADITTTQNGIFSTSEVTLPFPALTGQNYWALVLEPGPGRVKGEAIRLITTNGSPTASSTVSLAGCEIHVGLEYDMRADLGRFLLREEAGGGSAGISRGRTQVARMWVNYDNAAAFNVVVEVEGREARAHPMIGRKIGTPPGVASGGYPDFFSGRFSVPIQSENTRVNVTLSNPYPTPSSFLSIDWEGYHVSRGQHV